MKRNTIILLAAVFSLLLIGWILYQTINQDVPFQPNDKDFRSWFWEKRGLDLIVQVILVFAGALGISAILPIEDEDE